MTDNIVDLDDWTDTETVVEFPIEPPVLASSLVTTPRMTSDPVSIAVKLEADDARPQPRRKQSWKESLAVVIQDDDVFDCAPSQFSPFSCSFVLPWLFRRHCCVRVVVLTFNPPFAGTKVGKRVKLEPITPKLGKYEARKKQVLDELAIQSGGHTSDARRSHPLIPS
jgi:hypothetical protein